MTATRGTGLLLPAGCGHQQAPRVQQSLATVIFRGLLWAPVLSLCVVPPFYVSFKSWKERLFPLAQRAHEPG